MRTEGITISLPENSSSPLHASLQEELPKEKCRQKEKKEEWNCITAVLLLSLSCFLIIRATPTCASVYMENLWEQEHLNISPSAFILPIWRYSASTLPLLYLGSVQHGASAF